MAVSRKDPKRKQKLNTFKNKNKMSDNKQEQLKTGPKEFIVPVPKWAPDAKITMSGNQLEAFVSLIRTAYEAVGNLGRVVDTIVHAGIDAGAVTVEKIWNNGEKPTAEEIADFDAKAEEVRVARQAQFDEQQSNLVKDLKKKTNADITGLVNTDGSPIGTDQDLSEVVENGG